MYIKINIRYCLLLLFVICCQLTVSAQVKAEWNESTDDDGKVSPTNLAVARFQINDIKSRGIIVRLKTNKDKLTEYRKEGYKKQADKLEERSKLVNARLIHAFITEWTYSPVYFMESQYTTVLLLHDTLMAKTTDLLRDTAIYVNRDSFYIVDFGDLMATQLQNGQLNKTEESSTPLSSESIVVKDYHQKQLQPPMPYYSVATLIDVDKQPVAGDTTSRFAFEGLDNYIKNRDRQKASYEKDSVNKYLDRIYDHIKATKMTDKYTKTVARLNKNFISYYCKRLSKDRNLISNDDEIYWWHRNPNIRYIPQIPMTEQQLISYTDQGLKFTK